MHDELPDDIRQKVSIKYKYVEFTKSGTGNFVGRLGANIVTIYFDENGEPFTEEFPANITRGAHPYSHLAIYILKKLRLIKS